MRDHRFAKRYELREERKEEEGRLYQCLPEPDRSAHDREVLRAYSGLVRLFGTTDRAFFYAAAFGAGTSMTVDKTKCGGYIEDFRAAMNSSSRGQ